MDDNFKKLDFKDFITVDYAQMNDDLIAYRRKRLKNGAMHEETEQVDELSSYTLRSYKRKADDQAYKASERGDFAKSNKRSAGSDKASAKIAKKMAKRYNEETEQIDEVLSNAQRIKAGQRMKRMSKRIQIAKKRAMRRAPSMDVLRKRAKKQARTDMFKKLSKGTAKSDLSMGQRAAFEKRLKAKEKAIERNAKKLLPMMRKKDRDRRAAARKSQSEK